jgi:hypothetical protein
MWSMPRWKAIARHNQLRLSSDRLSTAFAYLSSVVVRGRPKEVWHSVSVLPSLNCRDHHLTLLSERVESSQASCNEWCISAALTPSIVWILINAHCSNCAIVGELPHIIECFLNIRKTKSLTKLNVLLLESRYSAANNSVIKPYTYSIN